MFSKRLSITAAALCACVAPFTVVADEGAHNLLRAASTNNRDLVGDNQLCDLNCPLGGILSTISASYGNVYDLVKAKDITTVDGCRAACSIDGKPYVEATDPNTLLDDMLQGGDGIHTISCTLIDEEGEPIGSTCTDTITVEGSDEVPALKCPSNVLLSTDYHQCHATFYFQDDPIVYAIDNSGLRQWAGVYCHDSFGNDIPLAIHPESRGNIEDQMEYVIDPQYRFHVGSTTIACNAFGDTRRTDVSSASCSFSVAVADPSGEC